MLVIVILATSLRLMSLGGGIYETWLIDPVWPKKPDLIRPSSGGIARARFWIPIHLSFEIAILVALIAAWSTPPVRLSLIVALACHIVMRAWSAIRFIPQALRFERGDPELTRDDATRWVRGSRWRLPLDFASAAAMMVALIASARS